MTEAQLLHDIQLALGALPHVRLFRNNQGLARDPRTDQHLRFGLAVGCADLLGIVKPRGRWVAIEVKSPTGRVRPEQAAFLAMIQSMGGVSGVARSVDEALALVEAAR